MNNCEHCNRRIADDFTLCGPCELAMIEKRKQRDFFCQIGDQLAGHFYHVITRYKDRDFVQTFEKPSAAFWEKLGMQMETLAFHKEYGDELPEVIITMSWHLDCKRGHYETFGGSR